VFTVVYALTPQITATCYHRRHLQLNVLMLSQYTYLTLWLGIHIASNGNHMESDLLLLIVTVIHVVLAKATKQEAQEPWDICMIHC